MHSKTWSLPQVCMASLLLRASAQAAAPVARTRRGLCIFSRLTDGLRSSASELRAAVDTQFEEHATWKRLVSFDGAPACERWVLKSDEDIGGNSSHSLVPSAHGTAVWSGSTSTAADPARQAAVPKSDLSGRAASRTGFCAMRTAVSDWGGEAWALHDFHGLCVRLRPDGRAYVLNVRCDSVLGHSRTEDLYQALVLTEAADAAAAAAKAEAEAEAEASDPHLQFKTKDSIADIAARSRGHFRMSRTATGGGAAGGEAGAAGELVDVRIPWGCFFLTWRGYVQGDRFPPPMNLERITHLGLLLADDADGRFDVELGEISAFRFSEDELRYDERARAGIRLNEEAGYHDHCAV